MSDVRSTAEAGAVLPEQATPLRPSHQSTTGSAPTVQHEVRLVDHHRFAQAVCTCGWFGAGRRARATARDEARDHALLYADANAFHES